MALLRTNIPRLKRLDLPRFIEPMKCKVAASLPAGSAWTYEIKFDGFRSIAIKDGKNVGLYSRNRKLLNDRFPVVAQQVSRLSVVRCVLDGEIVALDEHGRSSFQFLQNKTGALTHEPLHFYAFDLLHLNGSDLLDEPLETRKGLLAAWELPERIRLSHALPGTPQQIARQLQAHGLEGIIAKQKGSRYEPGQRSGLWQKFKWTCEQEFVIGGYTEPEGSRPFFGALVAGYFDQGRLRYASKIGTGYSFKMLENLHRLFQARRQSGCPFVNLPEPAPGFTKADFRRTTWLKPDLVCQVRFTEWTRDGHLRHPSFLGLRDDKNAEEVQREKPE